MKLEDLKNKNIHLVGVSGTEVSSLAFFLIGAGCKNLVGHDFKTKKDFKQSFNSYHDNLNEAQKNILYKKLIKGLKTINYRENYLKNIKSADLVLTASSYFRYPENKQLFKISKKITLWNWYNFFLEFYPGLTIGVTGTAGKGTLTNVLFKMIKGSGKKAFLIGDSWQAIDFKKIFSAGKNSVTVAEINNRTLTFTSNNKKSPAIAVLTNIFPHHLDDHNNSFSLYKKTKLDIFKYQKPGDRLVANVDDPVLKKIAWPKYAVFYSQKKNKLDFSANPYLKSPHIKSDALGAAKVAEILGVNKSTIQKALNLFSPRSGRMEFLGMVRGLNFVNDSASTRPKASSQAILSLPKGKTILILEGSRKYPLDKEYADLAKTIAKQKVKKIILSGKISIYLGKIFEQRHLDYIIVKNLTQAFNSAVGFGKSGDTILLSPSAESFGEFKDYRERTDKFNRLFLNYKKK